MAMVFAAALGISDALGALGPPETAVHFLWPATILLNAAEAGRIRAAAASGEDPDWLVVGLELALAAPQGQEPGRDPSRTTLAEEGCGEIAAVALLESWSRHTLVWINRWLEDGMAPLHADWRARARGIGEEIVEPFAPEPGRGVFMGIDETGNMLLRQDSTTRLVPLSGLLEKVVL